MKHPGKAFIVSMLIMALLCLEGCSLEPNAPLEETVKVKFKIEKVKEDSKIEIYYHSPDRKNYFLEKRQVKKGDNKGSLQHILHTYLNGEELLSSGKYIYRTPWHYFDYRKNRSIQPVKWIDNDKAIVIDGVWSNRHVYLFNINTGKREELELPIRVSDVHSCDLNNNNLNKAVFAGNNMFKKINYSVYLFDLQEKIWEELYSFVGGPFVNCIWGADGNIYFDAQTKGINSIKRYNFETGEITDFKKRAYLLNASPDRRYITYIDDDKITTKVYDLIKDTTYEVPYSEELEWHPSKNQFISVESDQFICINTINNNRLITEKYDIRDRMGDGGYIYNLQYDGSKIIFNIVNFDITVQNDKPVIDGINKVVTYEAEF